jgi:uncharacterized membrane protein
MSVWRRHRWLIIAAGVVVWLGSVTLLQRRVRERGTTKGAGELLLIGALPVT